MKARTLKTYSITYDLGKPGQNYPNLINKIVEVSTTWCRPTKSHWFINTYLTGAQLRDILTLYLDTNDTLMINDVGADWATWGMAKEVNDWLHQNWLPSRAHA